MRACPCSTASISLSARSDASSWREASQPLASTCRTFSFSCATASCSACSSCLSFFGSGTIFARSCSSSSLALSTLYLVSASWSLTCSSSCLRRSESSCTAVCWLKASCTVVARPSFSPLSRDSSGASCSRTAVAARSSLTSRSFSSSACCFFAARASTSCVSSTPCTSRSSRNLAKLITALMCRLSRFDSGLIRSIIEKSLTPTVFISF